MNDFFMGLDFKEHEFYDTKTKKYICRISNIILSILYGLTSWFFTFMGIMFCTLGVHIESIRGVFALLLILMLMLMPVFCILSIVFSVKLSKRRNYIASFMIQFLPFGVLGLAACLFLILMLFS